MPGVEQVNLKIFFLSLVSDGLKTFKALNSVFFLAMDTGHANDILSFSLFRNAVEENKKLYAIYDTRWVTKSTFKMWLLSINGMLIL